MKTIFILPLYLFTSYLFAQTKYSTVSEEFISYHDKISSAERMVKNDSLLQAYAKFDMAFNEYKGVVNPSHYYKAAMCAIKIKEEFKALYFLEKAIVGGYDLDSAKKSKIVFYNQNTKKEFIQNFPKWQEIGKSFRNIEWESQIIEMKETNKKYSSIKYTSAIEYCTACLKNKACNKTSPDFTSKYRLVKEKMSADSILAVTLVAKAQQLGFPSMKIVGKKANDIALSVLLNYDADKKNTRLDDFLYKSLINADISPEFYATLIDRRNVMSGFLPEFYEPITGYEKTISKEVATANKKRKTIGLYPIKLASSAAPKSKDPNANKKTIIGLYEY